MLRIAGVIIPESTTTTDCAGIPFNFGPKILLEPSFALTLQDLRDQFGPGCSFNPSATIIFRGKVVEGTYRDLIVHDFLEAWTPIEDPKHFIQTEIVFVPVEATDAEELRIRGFKPINKALQVVREAAPQLAP